MKASYLFSDIPVDNNPEDQTVSISKLQSSRIWPHSKSEGLTTPANMHSSVNIFNIARVTMTTKTNWQTMYP